MTIFEALCTLGLGVLGSMIATYTIRFIDKKTQK